MTLASLISVMPEPMALAGGSSDAGWWALLWAWLPIMAMIVFVGVIVDSVVYKPRR